MWFGTRPREGGIDPALNQAATLDLEPTTLPTEFVSHLVSDSLFHTDLGAVCQDHFFFSFLKWSDFQDRTYLPKPILGFSDSLIFGFLGSRVLGFSDFPIFCSLILGFRVLGFSSSRVLGFSGSRVVGFTGFWVLGFSGSRILGFLDCCFSDYPRLRPLAPQQLTVSCTDQVMLAPELPSTGTPHDPPCPLSRGCPATSPQPRTT